MNKFEAVFRDGSDLEPVTVKYFRKCRNIKKTYAILMTPRSGSTWLTHEIASYETLSHPDEYFIAEIFDQAILHNGSSNIYEYYDVVSNKMSSGEGIFGFEISYFDLDELEAEADLLSLMTGEKYFIYLTRDNFVSQAISMHIAKESGIYHSTNSEDASALLVRANVPYNAEKIRYWCSHILQQEYGFKTWLASRNIDFLKIQYEDMIADMTEVVQRIASHVEVELPAQSSPDAPRTVSVAAAYSDHYEQQFRLEHSEWCSHWTKNRGQLPCNFEAPWPFSWPEPAPLPKDRQD